MDFFLRQWLVLVSAAGLVLSSVYTRHLPRCSLEELEVLFILLVLFITVNGLQRTGIILKTARAMERGRGVAVQLVALTFFLAMLVTNDIALLVVVPLTLGLNIDRKDLLVILEALAANAGSALTPFGNPQNLFIYWFYGVSPLDFIRTIAPFSLFFFLLLLVLALCLQAGCQTKNHCSQPEEKIDRKAWIYGVLFLLVLLSVLHVLPVETGILVILFAVVFDRKALSVDYALLCTFFFFFGLAENLKLVLAAEIRHGGHIFLFSALASQVMSNVPAALLFARFTPHWDALLWGTNAGGFGSLFGSLANLIAYRIYVTDRTTGNTAGFTARFLLIGYGAFFLALGLYALVHRTGWL
jgi:Na+/H+ antiporter NhaD/arsenite permease-like protein